MKNSTVLMVALISSFVQALYGQISVEKVIGTCGPTPMEERTVLGVSEFKYAAAKGDGRVGSGLTDMLSNALVETGCFSVVERGRMDDLLEEQSLGMGGLINQSTAAQVGQLQGAQYLVMGTITEFSENESGIGGGTFLGKVGAAIGKTQAHVGMVIKIVDVTTGQVVVSKSVDKKVKKMGVIGGQGLIGVALAGAYKSKAMEDAIEEAILEVVQLFVQQKSILKAGESEGMPHQKMTRSDCEIVASGQTPTVMVLIPEVHISQRIPDPAGETEIIKRFIELGYNVVDPNQVNAIRDMEKANLAITNPDAAASLGREFGADIIIVGEAFSQTASRRNNLTSCRARVEARAIHTSTGRIIAADGKHAAGSDIAEMVAAKAALRNAGTEIAEYFLQMICSSDVSGASGSHTSLNHTMEILLVNASFAHVSQMEKFLKSKNGSHTVSKTFQGGSGRLNIMGSNSPDNWAEIISTDFTEFDLEITDFDGSKLTLAVL